MTTKTYNNRFLIDNLADNHGSDEKVGSRKQAPKKRRKKKCKEHTLARCSSEQRLQAIEFVQLLFLTQKYQEHDKHEHKPHHTQTLPQTATSQMLKSALVAREDFVVVDNESRSFSNRTELISNFSESI